MSFFSAGVTMEHVVTGGIDYLWPWVADSHLNRNHLNFWDEHAES